MENRKIGFLANICALLYALLDGLRAFMNPDQAEKDLDEINK